MDINKLKPATREIVTFINKLFEDKPSEFRTEIMTELKKEVDQFFEDEEYFFMGGGMS